MKKRSTEPWASAEIFPVGAKSKVCLGLSFFLCWRCNENGHIQRASPFLHHKENA